MNCLNLINGKPLKLLWINPINDFSEISIQRRVLLFATPGLGVGSISGGLTMLGTAEEKKLWSSAKFKLGSN